MTEEDIQPEHDEEIVRDIRKSLDTHGYSFQYAVLHYANELKDQGRSDWIFEAAEFPVEVSGAITHIDFILKTQSQRVRLVAECKRADPGRNKWCFIKAPYTWRKQHRNELVFQEIVAGPDHPISARARVIRGVQHSCHIGLEIKGHQKGDGIGGPKPITHATTQVLRGMNGLINHIYPVPGISYQKRQTLWFLPVIFTTAELWVVEGNISEASIETGLLPSEWGKAERVEWLWYTHNQSQSLKPIISTPPGSFDIEKYIRLESARSIAVVSPQGIASFLHEEIEEEFIH